MVFAEKNNNKIIQHIFKIHVVVRFRGSNPLAYYEGGYLRNTLRGGVIFYFYHRNQLVPGFGLKIEYVIDER